MPDFRQRLDDLIDKVLAGQLTVERFQEDFTKTFVDDMPDSALNSEELEQYGAVHEKSEWTAPDPPKMDRDAGWMTHAEFLSWLRSHRPAQRR